MQLDTIDKFNGICYHNIMNWVKKSDTLQVLMDNNVPIYGVTLNVMRAKYIILNLMNPPYILLASYENFESMENAKQFVDNGFKYA